MSEAALAERIARATFGALPTASQFDRGGRTYVSHFERVASRVEGDWTKAVAWLHDTVEDTDITLGRLKEFGLHPIVVEAVRLMTHPTDMTYEQYVDRIWANRNQTEAGSFAYRVKIADLCDNLDFRRAHALDGEPVQGGFKLRSKHQPALDRLLHGRWLAEPLP